MDQDQEKIMENSLVEEVLKKLKVKKLDFHQI
jgi:hypothetical protein